MGTRNRVPFLFPGLKTAVRLESPCGRPFSVSAWLFSPRAARVSSSLAYLPARRGFLRGLLHCFRALCRLLCFYCGLGCGLGRCGSRFDGSLGPRGAGLFCQLSLQLRIELGGRERARRLAQPLDVVEGAALGLETRAPQNPHSRAESTRHDGGLRPSSDRRRTRA